MNLWFPVEFPVLAWEQDCCQRAKALFLTFPGQPQLQFAQLAASPHLAGQPQLQFAQLAASPISRVFSSPGVGLFHFKTFAINFNF